MKLKNIFSKRVLAGIVALTTVTATSSLSSVNAQSSDRQYKVYRNSSSTLTKTYTLSALDEYVLPANARGLINPTDDSRDPLTGNPAQGIVRIVSADGNSYTGFIVGENIIATAASNVYDRSAGTFEKISTIYLHSANGTVNGTATASYVHIPSDYISTGVPYSNYALIKVSNNLSTRQVFELGVPTPEIDTSNVEVTVAGIPDVFENVANTNIKIANGNVTKYESQPTSVEFAYQIDVTDGQQGSPVYIHDTYYEYGTNDRVQYNIVLAINASGDDYNPMSGYNNTPINYGARMTPNILQFYKNNPNI